MSRKLKVEEYFETHLQGTLLNECIDFIALLKNEKCSFPKQSSYFCIAHAGKNLAQLNVLGIGSGKTDAWHNNIPHVTISIRGFTPSMFEYMDGDSTLVAEFLDERLAMLGDSLTKPCSAKGKCAGCDGVVHCPPKHGFFFMSTPDSMTTMYRSDKSDYWIPECTGKHPVPLDLIIRMLLAKKSYFTNKESVE